MSFRLEYLHVTQVHFNVKVKIKVKVRHISIVNISQMVTNLLLS